MTMRCLKIMIRCAKHRMDLANRNGSQESMKQWVASNQMMKTPMKKKVLMRRVKKTMRDSNKRMKMKKVTIISDYITDKL